MITGVRVILFCEQIDDSGGAVSALGLWDYTLCAGNRPGAVEATLLVQVELDPSPTRGHLRVEVADAYDEVFPFDFTTTAPVTAMMLPLLLPALDEGEVWVSVVDDATEKPWRYRWALNFAPDADPLGPSANEIAATCRESAAALRRRLTGVGALSPQ